MITKPLPMFRPLPGFELTVETVQRAQWELFCWRRFALKQSVGVVTLVLGRFLGYRDNIYNFEYGTNRSSKEKDMTINQLSAK